MGWLDKVGDTLGIGGGATGAEKKHRQMLMDYYGQIQQRQTPQMGDVAKAGYSGFRQNQSDLIDRLDAMSQGKGPSLAAAQMKAGMGRAQSQQASLANSGRGGPLMALAAANNMGKLSAQTNQDAGMARIGEQQMALSQLGMTLHSARGMDEANEKFNASQLNNTGLANLDARLRAMGMNDQARLNILSQFGQSAMNEGNRPSFGEQMLAGGASAFAASQGMGGGGMGGGGGGGGGIGAGSLMSPSFGGGGGWAPGGTPGSGIGSGNFRF